MVTAIKHNLLAIIRNIQTEWAITDLPAFYELDAGWLINVKWAELQYFGCHWLEEGINITYYIILVCIGQPAYGRRKPIIKVPEVEYYRIASIKILCQMMGTVKKKKEVISITGVTFLIMQNCRQYISIFRLLQFEVKGSTVLSVVENREQIFWLWNTPVQ